MKACTAFVPSWLFPTAPSAMLADLTAPAASADVPTAPVASAGVPTAPAAILSEVIADRPTVPATSANGTEESFRSGESFTNDPAAPVALNQTRRETSPRTFPVPSKKTPGVIAGMEPPPSSAEKRPVLTGMEALPAGSYAAIGSAPAVAVVVAPESVVRGGKQEFEEPIAG